jgi:IS5 family transposase
VNEDGLPLRVVVGPGNEHDCRRFEEVLEGLRVKKSGRGRARTRPKGVDADAADDAKAIRKARSRVERFFGWLKGGFRRLTVRHERRLATFLAFVLLAGCLIDRRILR